MRQFLRKTWRVLAYMFKREGFFTKKLVVGTMTLIMMLFVDIQCGIWNGMGLMLLVLLTLYVICIYIIRFMEMKREDKRMEEGMKNETENEKEEESLVTETDGVGEDVPDTDFDNLSEMDSEMEAESTAGGDAMPEAVNEGFSNPDNPDCGNLITKPETSDDNALKETNASDRHAGVTEGTEKEEKMRK